MSEHPSFTVAELTAMPYRELQRLSKRDDVQAWATIRLNSSAQQLIKHLQTFFESNNPSNNQSNDQSHIQSHNQSTDLSNNDTQVVTCLHQNVSSDCQTDQPNAQSIQLACTTDVTVPQPSAQSVVNTNQAMDQSDDQPAVQSANQPIQSITAPDLSMQVPVMKRAPETGKLTKPVPSKLPALVQSTKQSNKISTDETSDRKTTTHQRSQSAMSVKPVSSLHQRNVSQPAIKQSVSELNCQLIKPSVSRSVTKSSTSSIKPVSKSITQSVSQLTRSATSIKPDPRPTAAARVRPQIEKAAPKKQSTSSIKPISKSINETINKSTLSRSSKPVMKSMTSSIKPVRQSNIDKKPVTQPLSSRTTRSKSPVVAPIASLETTTRSKSIEPSVPVSAPTRLKRKEPVTSSVQAKAKKTKTSDQTIDPVHADQSITQSISQPIEPATAPSKSAYDDFMRDLSSRVEARTAGPPQVSRPVVNQSISQTVVQPINQSINQSDDKTSKTSKRPAVKSLSQKFDAMHRRNQAASKSIVDVENEKNKRAQALSIKQSIKPSSSTEQSTNSIKPATKSATAIKPSRPLSTTNKSSSLSATKPQTQSINQSIKQSNNQPVKPAKSKWRFEPMDNKENVTANTSLTSVNSSDIQWMKPKAFVPPVLAHQPFTSQFQ